MAVAHGAVMKWGFMPPMATFMLARAKHGAYFSGVEVWVMDRVRVSVRDMLQVVMVRKAGSILANWFIQSKQPGWEE